MKALTLTPLHAVLVAHGLKRLETRGWSTKHRGPVAIHAALRMPKWARDLCYREPFRSALVRAGYRSVSDLPHGAVLCVVDFLAVYRTEDIRPILGAFGPDELYFGDFSSKRFATLLRVTVELPRPLPVRGHLGLWDLPGDMSAYLACLMTAGETKPTVPQEM